MKIKKRLLQSLKLGGASWLLKLKRRSDPFMNDTKLSPSLSVFISSNKLIRHELMSDSSFLGVSGVKTGTCPISASVQITAYHPSGLYLAVSVHQWAIQQRGVFRRPSDPGREYQEQLRQAIDDGIAADFPDFKEWSLQNLDAGQP
jgi:hypothetical protein